MGGLMVKPVSHDGKAEVLAGSRTLNPHPGSVTDAVFEGENFFDARDLVQVKYEMVRKTDVEDVPVAVAAAAFGFSRQSLYTARAALREQGLAGHKLTSRSWTIWKRWLLPTLPSARWTWSWWSPNNSGLSCIPARSGAHWLAVPRREPGRGRSKPADPTGEQPAGARSQAGIGRDGDPARTRYE